MNNVQFWQFGHNKLDDFETVIKITTPSPNYTFKWYQVDGVVDYYDWDNGVQNNSISHTFTNIGTYTIKIVGKILRFQITNQFLTIPIEIVKVSKSITSFAHTFQYCRNLQSIPAGLFDKNVNVTSFTSTFHYCLNLQSIPAGLFDNNVNVTSFESTFYNCRILQSIPVGLFDNSVNVISFTSTFNYCLNLSNRPKPKGLELWQLAGTVGYPASISVYGCFRDCTSLPDYNSLPEIVK